MLLVYLPTTFRCFVFCKCCDWLLSTKWPGSSSWTVNKPFLFDVFFFLQSAYIVHMTEISENETNSQIPLNVMSGI